MAQIIVELVLSADVADSADLTLAAYPTGTNQAFFTSGNASATGVVIVNDNDVWLETAGQIDITYDSTDIDIKNDSGVTWKAGSRVLIGLGYARPEVVTVVQQPTIADLGGTLTGVVDGDLADVPALDIDSAGGNTYADATVEAAVATMMETVDKNFKEVQTKVNTLLARLEAAGVLSTT